MSPLLSVENLRIAFPSRQGPVEVVRGVSFELGRERLGIVGESGSGKSQTGRAILGLTPVSGKATADLLEFDGIDLRDATPAKWRSLRGARMSMVMQDPKFSLNPVMTIGKQLMEAVKLHGGKSEARDKSLAMLEAVQIRDPERVMAAYPHELSGGMGQRAMIAMMLVTEPDLLIADEPTSALDVTVQIEVLRILDRLVSERGMGLIFISHDLELVSTFCDRVLVMYAGRVVEELDAAKMSEAQHPYTRGLIGCLPKINGDVRPLPVLARDAAWLE
ncbi:MAG: ABC transporter ATP-binding protein [Hoeflea sp.]|uniref:ABC transporter ATP-binding protein n=1 Tax=Hoeflea sp. TaxID=1940281 RepID=UPI001D6E837D|nr:ABC transporter ATP-binding protein [Hoeflea sp.]MBU4531330.1 ABC transporter ATP-binding protein [Alphaproteobacteria bacterium]MBU4544187.1 ABC transporter ATP-binding protein [Alphaproteobacteria bacterium]MBU4550576.1 ABC transporter ATP-binding protein [Alphaproteobacteria bacterium]MBV1724606.1 ABC transporter ATP-binding protein [Hoeflea sp.]MBV1760626.1 ABC transporter ATP-binding protein [Hoeflea sp.]